MVRHEIPGILSWRKQEVKKPHNVVLRAGPAWSINSGKIESRPGRFPGFRRLEAIAISFDVNGPTRSNFYASIAVTKIK